VRADLLGGLAPDERFAAVVPGVNEALDRADGSPTEVNVPRRIAWRVMIPKAISPNVHPRARRGDVQGNPAVRMVIDLLRRPAHAGGDPNHSAGPTPVPEGCQKTAVHPGPTHLGWPAGISQIRLSGARAICRGSGSSRARTLGFPDATAVSVS
jgi:hypothetical protein